MRHSKADVTMPATATGARAATVYCPLNAGGAGDALTTRLDTPALASAATTDGRATLTCRQVQVAANGATTTPLSTANVRITATKVDSLQVLTVTPSPRGAGDQGWGRCPPHPSFA